MLNTNSRPDQARDLLFDYIKQHQLTQGDQLPSEAEMAKTIGVSRNTVREAYVALESEGIIVRQHGVGTFVAQTTAIKESLMTELTGLYSRIKASNYEPRLRELSVEYTTAPSEIAEVLGVSPSDLLLCVKRVLVANDIPAVYLIDYFHRDSKVADYDWDLFDGNMVSVISEVFGVGDIFFHSRFVAVATDIELAGYLSLLKNQPIIKVLSTMTTLDKQAIGYSIVYFNPNIVELDITRIIRST